MESSEDVVILTDSDDDDNVGVKQGSSLRKSAQPFLFKAEASAEREVERESSEQQVKMPQPSSGPITSTSSSLLTGLQQSNQSTAGEIGGADGNNVRKRQRQLPAEASLQIMKREREDEDDEHADDLDFLFDRLGPHTDHLMRGMSPNAQRLAKRLAENTAQSHSASRDILQRSHGRSLEQDAQGAAPSTFAPTAKYEDGHLPLTGPAKEEANLQGGQAQQPGRQQLTLSDFVLDGNAEEAPSGAIHEFDQQGGHHPAKEEQHLSSSPREMQSDQVSSSDGGPNTNADVADIPNQDVLTLHVCDAFLDAVEAVINKAPLNWNNKIFDFFAKSTAIEAEEKNRLLSRCLQIQDRYYSSSASSGTHPHGAVASGGDAQQPSVNHVSGPSSGQISSKVAAPAPPTSIGGWVREDAEMTDIGQASANAFGNLASGSNAGSSITSMGGRSNNVQQNANVVNSAASTRGSSQLISNDNPFPTLRIDVPDLGTGSNSSLNRNGQNPATRGAAPTGLSSTSHFAPSDAFGSRTTAVASSLQRGTSQFAQPASLSNANSNLSASSHVVQQGIGSSSNRNATTSQFTSNTGASNNISINSASPGAQQQLQQAREILRSRFGHRDFRSKQADVISSVLQGKDVLTVMPTGSGKSICYQIPAVLQNSSAGKVCFVVSPLLSLMKDQCDNLRRKNIDADWFSGDKNWDTIRPLLERLENACGSDALSLSRNRPPCLVYLSPEKLIAALGKESAHSHISLQGVLNTLYRNGKISLFVIDEAHCVSEWGLDFRPEYRRLSVLRSRFPNVPLLAATASATEACRRDIVKNLFSQNQLSSLSGGRQSVTFVDSFNRKNIRFQVLPKTTTLSTGGGKYSAAKSEQDTAFYDMITTTLQDSLQQDYMTNLSTPGGGASSSRGGANNLNLANAARHAVTKGSAILYVLSKAEADSVAQGLQRRKNNGITALPYHAGLPPETRRQNQEAWMKGVVQVIVATVAFGMGIDKPDVRFIGHLV